MGGLGEGFRGEVLVLLGHSEVLVLLGDEVLVLLGHSEVKEAG